VAAALLISATATIIVMVRFIVLFLFPASGSDVATEMVERPATIAAECDQTSFAVNQYSPHYVRKRT